MTNIHDKNNIDNKAMNFTQKKIIVLFSKIFISCIYFFMIFGNHFLMLETRNLQGPSLAKFE